MFYTTLHHDSNKQDSSTIVNICVNILGLCSRAWPQILKGCVDYIFASLFVSLKGGTCETRKNNSSFTSKALIVLEIIKF